MIMPSVRGRQTGIGKRSTSVKSAVISVAVEYFFFHTIWKSSALNGGQVFPIQPCFLSVISIQLEEAHYHPAADGGALNRLRSPLLPGWRSPTAL